MEKFHNKS